MRQRGVRLWKPVALLLVATMVMAACGSDDDKDTGNAGGKRELTIAFVGAKTGDSANLGLNIRDGVKLAVDEENQAGGDVTIRLKEFDTAGSKDQANTIKSQFIGDNDVVGIVGPAFSGETRAVLGDLQQAGLPMITPSATNKDLASQVPPDGVFHRALGDDILQASGIAEYLNTVEKPKSVAYVYDNSPEGAEYAKALTEDVEKKVSASGVRRVLLEALDPKAPSFLDTITKVKNSGAGLVFYGGYYEAAGRFRKELVDNNVKVPFVSGDGSLDPGFVENAGADKAEGARLTCPCNLAFESSQGALKKFYDDYKRSAGKEPGLYSPEGYDAAKILIKGIKAGNDTRQKLLNYLENEVRVYEGVSKIIEWEPNGNIKARQFFVFQVKAGKIVPLQEITLSASPTGSTTTTSSTGSTTSTTRRQTTSSSTSSSTTSSTGSTTSSSMP